MLWSVHNQKHNPAVGDKLVPVFFVTDALIARLVARYLRPQYLGVVFVHHTCLNDVTAVGIQWVGNVRVDTGPTFCVTGQTIVYQFGAALVAIACPQ